MKKILVTLVALGLFSSCSSPRPSQAPSPSVPTEVVQSVSPMPSPTPTAAPGMYHRLYQGYSLKGMKRPEFTKTMNTKFFPLFVTAQSHGLAAYRPALPKSPQGCTLPNEIALLSFQTEKVYSKYKDSKIGKKIKDAHALAFIPDTSKSLVPEPLVDTIQYEHAYSLNPGAHDYRKLNSALIIHCDPAVKGEELRLSLVKTYAGGTAATDILFAVAPGHLVEYVFYANAADFKKRIAEREQAFSSLYRQSSIIELPKKKLAKAKLSVGDGLDAQR